MNAAFLTNSRDSGHHSRQVLPRVWATASVATASGLVRERCQQRKGPHRLTLVQAAAQVMAPAATKVREMPRSRRDVEAGLVFYRKYTEGLLQRYMKMSMEKGRVPSLLGRELFRGMASSYHVTNFDDAIIFLHDVERCMAQLEPGLRYLVRRIALEEYTQAETAAMTGVSLRTVSRRYSEAVDRLTSLFITRRLLQPFDPSLTEA